MNSFCYLVNNRGQLGAGIIWRVIWLCLCALISLTALVQSGLAFRWWDFPLGHLAEQAAQSYTHPFTIAMYGALNLPGDLRVDAALALAATLTLVWRRAGWLSWAPLLFLLTAPIEYLTKNAVHSPIPTPLVVQQSSLVDAQITQSYVPQTPCPLSLDLAHELAAIASCQGGSYLSGAAARIAIIAGVILWWIVRRRRPRSMRWAGGAAVVLYVIAAGVGRVYLRWHWPSDVIGGYLLGALILCVLWLLAHPAPRGEAG